MGKLGLVIALDVVRIKVEKAIVQFGLGEPYILNSNMLKVALKNLYKNDIQLLILDVDHPDYDWKELLLAVQTHPQNNQIPIVAIGNSSDTKFIKQLTSHGITDYVSKPIEEVQFVSRLNLIMRDKANRATIEAAETQNITSAEDSKLEAIVEQNKDSVAWHEKISKIKFTWSSDFETHIEQIDKDHKEIIDAYENLYLKMKDGMGHEFIKELVHFLNDYIETHFEREEAFMAEIGYSELEAHRNYHQEFTVRVKQLSQSLGESPNNNDLIKVNLLIKNWLINHIVKEDMKIHYFIQNQ